jgi:hypothetical protein
MNKTHLNDSNLIIQLSNKIYELKQNLLDSEFLQIMNIVKQIYDKHQFSEPENTYICECDETTFCYNSIRALQCCKNYTKICLEMPLLPFIIKIYWHPLNKYINDGTQLPHLQITPIFNETINKYKFTIYMGNLLFLADSLDTNITIKSLIILIFYEYAFQNINYALEHIDFLIVLRIRLNEFIESYSHYYNEITQLYNLDENILHIYKHHLDTIITQY